MDKNLKDLTPLHDILVELYGPEEAQATFQRLSAMIDRYRLSSPLTSQSRRELTQQDSILITYGDQVSQPGIPPLQSLADFCAQHLDQVISAIHILPFYPYSSDDGFSVIDYKTVDPALGTWADVASIGRTFRLMFDAVINHISAQSQWFKAYLSGDPRYSLYFIEVSDSPDLSQVVRPRALPLLTSFDTPSGNKAIWTTFSTDQVDLNYHNPDVLLEIMDTLFFYAAQGADFIRLDAIAYLWKEIGTACIHLPQTHRIIQLIRAALDAVFPQVLIISETNVPHAENLSYFGDGNNEAQLVYNFALPPLVLHTLQTGSALALTRWANTLALPSKAVAFFNFLASHDGIGLNPARGILTEPEITALVERTLAHGGIVSYKSNPDGTQSPYELNINYFDALSNPFPLGGEAEQVQVARFMTAQSIMLALAGVPGIYFHSLFGSRGWPEGVQLTGRNRTINRQKLERLALEGELRQPASRRSQVFERYARMLKARAARSAFSPNAGQEIIDCGETVFALLRFSPDKNQRVLCLHNISNRIQAISLDWVEIFKTGPITLKDILTNQSFDLNPGDPWTMQPYQVNWLERR
jgi:glucosylglycerate phosphorylase